MRIGEFHVMTDGMINRFSTIMQIKSILIGMCMITRTKRTGAETQTNILRQVFQITVGHHLATISKPYGFGSICRKLAISRSLLAGCKPVETCFKLGIISVIGRRIPSGIWIIGSAGKEIGKGTTNT